MSSVIGKAIGTPSWRVVWTEIGVTPEGISDGSTWTPEATYAGVATLSFTSKREPTSGGLAGGVSVAVMAGVGSPRMTMAVIPYRS